MKAAYKVRGCECREFCHSEENPCRERPKDTEDLANFDVAHLDASTKTHWRSGSGYDFVNGDGPASAARFGMAKLLEEYLKSRVRCKPCHVVYDNHRGFDCSEPEQQALPLSEAAKEWMKNTSPVPPGGQQTNIW
jgi:hypothetical protein